MRSALPPLPGDNYDEHRAILAAMSRVTSEYCGLPVTIAGERLILAPGHPAAQVYAEVDAASFVCQVDERAQDGMGPDPDEEGSTLVNEFWSMRKRGQILIWRDAAGQTQWGVEPGIHHFSMDMRTMGCSLAWSLDAELKAQALLQTLIKPHLFKSYLLTGMFMETSQKSGVMYVFRRLRPTVALSWRQDQGGKILCCLCLHPIGYYRGTWSGGLCPTDDVIAHLLLMRADEAYYWRKSNQIPAWRPEAGL